MALKAFPLVPFTQAMTNTVPCGVCSTPVKGRNSYGDRLYYDCPRCGLFGLTGTADSLLPSWTEGNPRAAAILSFTIRNTPSEGDDTPFFGWDACKKIMETCHLPLPSEQADRLIRWLGDTLPGPGEEMIIAFSHHGSIIGAQSEEGFDFVVDNLVATGLLQTRGLSINGGTQVTLSFPGWDRYRQLGRTSAPSREVFVEPTGWQKVDRQLQEIRTRLQAARTEEQYQAVGLICREALISVAQEMFDSTRHPTTDGVSASSTDAQRMLEAIMTAELAGGANEEARAHAKASLRLALALQHKRTADFRMAALCEEATSSVINILAVLAGRRARPPL
jgi:hypothetical protein